ncbi:MAG: hypothetical protein QXV55_02835 [Acidilobaceae archaeon]
MDILLTGSLVFTGKELIKRGYVYIRDGRIVGVGEEPYPDDYSYANLILGGPGRIIAPALTAIASLPYYPFRLRKSSMRERVEFYKSLDPTSLFMLSLPALYDLHTSGISTIVVETLDVEFPLRLSKEIGGLYGLALPACSDEKTKYVEGLVAITRVSGEGCEGESDIVEIGGLGYYRGSRVLGFFSGYHYITSSGNTENPWLESLELRKALMLPSLEIKPGRIAEIAVFDGSRPPLLLAENDLDEDTIVNIYKLGLRVESLIVGDDVLIDTGDHLYITEKHFKEARDLGEKIKAKQRSSMLR